MAITPGLTWGQFKAIPNGTVVRNHFADECVALANLYHEYVLGKPFVPVGSAFQWWTLFNALPTLYQNYRQSQSPIAGAVVVSRWGIYNGKDGHIEVVVSVNPDGTFNTMGQNGSGHRYVWRYRRTMQNILGFLHPVNNPASQVAPAKKAVSILKRKRSKEQNELIFIYLTQGSVTTYAILRPGVKGSWWQFVGQKAADSFASQLGNAAPVDLGAWEDLKKRSS